MLGIEDRKALQQFSRVRDVDVAVEIGKGIFKAGYKIPPGTEVKIIRSQWLKGGKNMSVLDKEVVDGIALDENENGILQLVDENIHAEFTHIGGYSIYK